MVKYPSIQLKLLHALTCLEEDEKSKGRVNKHLGGDVVTNVGKVWVRYQCPL